MKLVDSSGWLEFFMEGPLAGEYAAFLSVPPGELVTPSIVLYEVYKVVKRQQTEEAALIAAGQMEKTRILPLDLERALRAADLSLEYGLAMEDAIVYAAAQEYQATLITSDSDFAGLPGVVYLEKKPQGEAS